MARYEHLPIYREAFALCVFFENLVRGMARYDKYTLGAELRNLSREVLRLIMRANSEADRIGTLREIRAKVEELKVVLRLARETRAIGRVTSYEFAAGKVAWRYRPSYPARPGWGAGGAPEGARKWADESGGVGVVLVVLYQRQRT